MAVPSRVGPQESVTVIEKTFLHWLPMNIYKDWKAKSDSPYFFMLKYSKITVCCLETSPLREVHAGGAWAPFTAF